MSDTYTIKLSENERDWILRGCPRPCNRYGNLMTIIGSLQRKATWANPNATEEEERQADIWNDLGNTLREMSE